MIREISIGDKIKCLRCGKTIDVTNQTFTSDAYAEYICCPMCNLKLDVQAYHHYGEKDGVTDTNVGNITEKGGAEE